VVVPLLMVDQRFRSVLTGQQTAGPQASAGGGGWEKVFIALFSPQGGTGPEGIRGTVRVGGSGLALRVSVGAGRFVARVVSGLGESRKLACCRRPPRSRCVRGWIRRGVNGGFPELAGTHGVSRLGS